MESQRSILIIALAFVSFLLWQQWHEDYGPKPIEPIAQDTTQVAAGVPSASTSVPSTGSDDVPLALGDDVPAVQASASASQSTITVTTDTLDLTINLVGGDVVEADLLQFPVTQDSDEPYSLLRPANGLYVAQSGLVGRDGPDGNASGRPLYQAASSHYDLEGVYANVSWCCLFNSGRPLQQIRLRRY